MRHAAASLQDMLKEYTERKLLYKKSDIDSAQKAGVVFTLQEEREIQAELEIYQKVIDHPTVATAIEHVEVSFDWASLPARTEKAKANKEKCSLAALHEAYGHTGVL
jgi:molybdopterin-biosynthesis enzyme MoeA-like protein